MKNNKKVIISALILGAVALAGAYGISKVSANENGNAFGQNSIIQKLASRFNLNENDVKTVFEENRNEMQNKRQEECENRLSKLADEGKITQEQKGAIQKKQQEMRKENENRQAEMKNLSQEERKATQKNRQEERNKHQEEMKKWAEENGIDTEVLNQFMSGRINSDRGQFGGGFRGNK